MVRDTRVKLRSPLAALLVIVLLAPLGATPEPVRISTIVTDKQGKPVTGLAIKDFEVRP
jgi:hypothetical protein